VLQGMYIEADKSSVLKEMPEELIE